MKLWTSNYLFKHTWETVTQALWRKYPNDLNPNVKAIDVVDRTVTEDGKLHTTRILGTQWNFPTFITQLLGMPDMCYALEHSIVDLKSQTMTMKSVNLTFSSVMEVEETIIYKVNPDDNTTLESYDRNFNFQVGPGTSGATCKYEMAVPDAKTFRDLTNTASFPKLTKVAVDAYLSTFDASLKAGNRIYDSRTHMSQEAAINITGVAFKDYCEGMIASAFDSNANKGREAIEQVIAKISLENVLHTITEQMDDLCHSLEEAKKTISSGLDEITSKLTDEFDDIKGKLNNELDGLALLLQGQTFANDFTKTTKSTVTLRVNPDLCHKPSLTSQVIEGGFTAR